MNKRIALFLCVFFLVVTSFSFVSSIPPWQVDEVPTSGLFIESTNSLYLEQNHDHIFHFRVYDGETGVYVSPNDVTCGFGISNDYGDIIYSNNNVTTLTGYRYNVLILGGNFSWRESYNKGINCQLNDGTKADVITQSFQITKTGSKIEQSQSILYLAMILGLIIFLIVSIYGAISIPYKNVTNDDGKIISINDKKYLKILSIFLTYGILTWLANIMISISSNYIDIGLSSTFFTVIFKILISLLYPTLIFTIILMAIQFSKDLKIGKLLDRGL